jgi:hypothetical protein
VAAIVQFAGLVVALSAVGHFPVQMVSA